MRKDLFRTKPWCSLVIRLFLTWCSIITSLIIFSVSLHGIAVRILFADRLVGEEICEESPWLLVWGKLALQDQLDLCIKYLKLKFIPISYNLPITYPITISITSITIIILISLVNCMYVNFQSYHRWVPTVTHFRKLAC